MLPAQAAHSASSLLRGAAVEPILPSDARSGHLEEDLHSCGALRDAEVACPRCCSERPSVQAASGFTVLSWALPVKYGCKS